MWKWYLWHFDAVTPWCFTVYYWINCKNFPRSIMFIKIFFSKIEQPTRELIITSYHCQNQNFKISQICQKVSCVSSRIFRRFRYAKPRKVENRFSSKWPFVFENFGNQINRILDQNRRFEVPNCAIFQPIFRVKTAKCWQTCPLLNYIFFLKVGWHIYTLRARITDIMVKSGIFDHFDVESAKVCKIDFLQAGHWV